MDGEIEVYDLPYTNQGHSLVSDPDFRLLSGAPSTLHVAPPKGVHK